MVTDGVVGLTGPETTGTEVTPGIIWGWEEKSGRPFILGTLF